MEQHALNQMARDILKQNRYLTLATSDGKRPWAAPVYYTHDDAWHLYFISKPSSVHIQQISKHPIVAFAIFDSHQPEGTGNGIQGVGTVSEVLEHERENALRWYRTSLFPLNKESIIGDAPYRLFKLSPLHLYILNPEATTDERLEVWL
jgi:uncharacterized protein YhbP (UPF0306 family)